MCACVCKFSFSKLSWKKILRSHMIMVVSLMEAEMKVKDTLKKITRDKKNSLKNHYDQIVGFAWILLITGEANQALQERAGIESATELIVSLMTKQAIPARTESTETDTFQIGALYFKFPYKEVWTTAQRIAKDLSKTLIAGTYGTKKRIYDVLVFAKARQQVKKWSMNTNIIDKTKDVHEFIRNCPTRDAKIMFCKIKKDLVKATIAAARRKNTTLEKRKSKDRTRVACKARATTNEEKESEERTPTKTNKTINFKAPPQKLTEHQNNNNNYDPNKVVFHKCAYNTSTSTSTSTVRNSYDNSNNNINNIVRNPYYKKPNNNIIIIIDNDSSVVSTQRTHWKQQQHRTSTINQITTIPQKGLSEEKQQQQHIKS